MDTQLTAPSNIGTPSSVLILDDDPNLCSMLQDILQEYEFRTATALTPEEALALLKKDRYHVALVDFRLGNTTGIEAAGQLLAIDQNLPVILMTAYPSLDLAIKAIQNNIYDFIPKPVDATYLLRSINKALEKRRLIEENQQLIAFLKESNTKLDRMNSMKSKFLSFVTHDLRTPLTSILGYIEFMRDQSGLSADEETRCFTAIENSAKRMNYLIGNLFDLISMEVGKLRTDPVEMDYLTIFKDLKETFTPIFKERQTALEWQLPSQPVPILGDANRLIQMMSNLIGNTLKHTEKGGRVMVCVTVNQERVLTEIIDDGEGIQPEDQKKIFEQYFQVESSATKRQGLGLGLSIAGEIVQLHNGEISVKSEGLNKGSNFHFTLPLRKKPD